MPNDPNTPAFDNTKPPNPYLTVDFIENLPVRNRVEWDDTERAAGSPALGCDEELPDDRPQAPLCRGTRLRCRECIRHQPGPGAAMPANPEHSFFSANTTYSNTALIHFDRELINSSELMHVSIQPPHLLTAAFADGAGTFNLHTRVTPASITALLDAQYPAPGLGTQLFRAFELLTTANRIAGNSARRPRTGSDQRQHGRDSRIFQAVLDPALPQQGNTFDPTFVNNGMVKRRSGHTHLADSELARRESDL